ncbi:hypothetical protein [Vibrio sp. Y29_XK_CS5]|uniref:hypothetical protein n=1 Tax=Vibrio sp. Y29_XK_CS5 TaxID=2957762 RepID=UPI0020A551D5|nr:hypothetical protein [Vibrio sp. Y29_XK_CS5]
MNEAQIIYYDLLPDYTVSVLVKGCDEWDLLKSMSHLESWACRFLRLVGLVFSSTPNP